MPGNSTPSTSTLDDSALPWEVARREALPALELVIGWSLDEPGRVGEGAPVAGPLVLGRGENEAPHTRFRACRPGAESLGTALESARISRSQLRLRPGRDASLHVENVGKCKLLVNGEERAEAEVHPGDTVTLKNALVLLVIQRLPWAPGAPPGAKFPFGKADAHGIVGESLAAWKLRSELNFMAANRQHVLLSGPSGVGKELAAQALHALSARGRRPLIARNAATLPEGLVDAELFGTARNYPNVGSAERPGLLGEADGSSLFLDEIGELPPSLQAHLLRVLDHGEYQRLGDATARRSDVRVIAATNRALDALKHDFVARFTGRIEIVGLNDRREDIPLLLQATLHRAAAENPVIRERFFDSGGRPRVHPDLIDALVRHRYTLHTRELNRLLWRAISTSPADFVALTPEVLAELTLPAVGTIPERAAVEAALAAAGGRAALAAESLGLSSRYALYRLMKKYGIGEDPG